MPWSAYDQGVRDALGIVAPKKVESNTNYTGERASIFSFFFQFPEIIFRWNGSVLKYIVIEVCLATGLGIVAYYYCADEQIKPIGHQIVGVLLAFLVVFRNQIAWGMYSSGRGHVESLKASSYQLATEATGVLRDHTPCPPTPSIRCSHTVHCPTAH